MTQHDQDSPNSNLGPLEHDAAVPVRVITKISLMGYYAVSLGNQLPILLAVSTFLLDYLEHGGGGVVLNVGK